jgi:hypothetical protein
MGDISMDKNYYIQKYESRMMEIYEEFADDDIEDKDEYCTRWFDETANAEEVVGYYFVHYEWNPLKCWLENLEFVKNVTEQDGEVTRILMELCGK